MTGEMEKVGEPSLQAIPVQLAGLPGDPERGDDALLFQPLKKGEDLLALLTQSLGHFVAAAMLLGQKREECPLPEVEIEQALVAKGGIEALDLLARVERDWPAGPSESEECHRPAMDEYCLHPVQVSAQKGEKTRACRQGR
jgi:hypothetical protein